MILEIQKLKINIHTIQIQNIPKRSISLWKLRKGHQANLQEMVLQVPKTLLTRFPVRILKVIQLKVFVIANAP